MVRIVVMASSVSHSNTLSLKANFAMPSTYLTLGGFTQPCMARNVIEMPSSAEKGFAHNFLWFFPRPLYKKSNYLTEIPNLCDTSSN